MACLRALAVVIAGLGSANSMGTRRYQAPWRQRPGKVCLRMQVFFAFSRQEQT
jgi:hypothetical protein